MQEANLHSSSWPTLGGGSSNNWAIFLYLLKILPCGRVHMVHVIVPR